MEVPLIDSVDSNWETITSIASIYVEAALDGEPQHTEVSEDVHEDSVPEPKTKGKWRNGGPGRPPKPESEKLKGKQYPTMRVYPKLVCELVKKLGPVRRKWVKRAGFGSLLELRIDKVHRKYCMVVKSVGP